jgi:hypothetical protein
MQKHIADQPRDRSDTIRLRRLLEVERRRKAPTAARAIYRAPRGTESWLKWAADVERRAKA